MGFSWVNRLGFILRLQNNWTLRVAEADHKARLEIKSQSLPSLCICRHQQEIISDGAFGNSNPEKATNI